MLATGGKKAEAPKTKPTLEQIKDAVKFNASSRCVVGSMRGDRVAYTRSAVRSEEEELYVLAVFMRVVNGLSTTGQGQQHQEVCCRRREGIKTLIPCGAHADHVGRLLRLIVLHPPHFAAQSTRLALSVDGIQKTFLA